jgi:spermidine synthase
MNKPTITTDAGEKPLVHTEYEPREVSRNNFALYAGIFGVSAATLLLELTLTRIFDVILQSNLAYLIVSSAMLGFGLGGIFVLLKPLPEFPTEKLLAIASLAFCFSVLFLFPAMKWLPLNVANIPDHPVQQLPCFGILYLVLLVPFFFSGLVIATALTRNSDKIHRLYFWDLFGAGLGCLCIFVLPPAIGAEETLLVVAAAGALGAAFFVRKTGLLRKSGVIISLLLAAASIVFSNKIEFRHLIPKRGIERQKMEFSRWDPVSKIDVLKDEASPFKKRIAYDGGAQSSMMHAFDGDFEALRARYFHAKEPLRYNSGKYVALAHWLKRTNEPRTLIIGSAGGQETLAALTWGASHVDAVEMVGTVVDLCKGPYAGFTGNIFNHPKVTLVCDEGRSFLRHAGKRYDIIQIHSNHTTSSLAYGSGGAIPIYLQTVEAYEDYLSHLTDDGILQINYFVYPRMITTAAQAWARLHPGQDFRQHLLITSGYGIMTTFLVKASVWTKEEVGAVRQFLSKGFANDLTQKYRLIYAPGETEAANVPTEFFEVPLNRSFRASLPYEVFPPTDDQPFFRDLRKNLREIEADTAGFVPADTAEFMNASLVGFIPMEKIHLYLLGGFSIVVATVFVFGPLMRLRRQGLSSPVAIPALVYFSCLGAGFIMCEIVLMYKLVLLIGHPIYSMAAVIFTLLVSAAAGSFLSEYLVRRWQRRAILVIPLFGFALALLLIAFPVLRDLTLGMGQVSRILLVSAFLVPIGIPLGMPFPIGVQALSSAAPNLIPWAWGTNAFTTVVGSVLSVVLSIKFGFDVTLCIAIAIYLIASVAFVGIRPKHS